MAKKKTNTPEILKLIGALFFLLSPIAFALVQTVFKDSICDPDIVNSCGFQNLGILAYGLSYALIPLVVGIICFILGAILKKRT